MTTSAVFLTKITKEYLFKEDKSLFLSNENKYTIKCDLHLQKSAETLSGYENIICCKLDT